MISCVTVFDCIIGTKPKLISNDLYNGHVAYNYEENILFEMGNGNTSDYFISDVSIQDNIPPGLDYVVTTTNTIKIFGTPTIAGTFDFGITIIVEPNNYNTDDSDQLCEDISTKRYQIVIY
jgi:hypothetical protein